MALRGPSQGAFGPGVRSAKMSLTCRQTTWTRTTKDAEVRWKSQAWEKRPSWRRCGTRPTPSLLTKPSTPLLWSESWGVVPPDPKLGHVCPIFSGSWTLNWNRHTLLLWPPHQTTTVVRSLTTQAILKVPLPEARQVALRRIPESEQGCQVWRYAVLTQRRRAKGTALTRWANGPRRPWESRAAVGRLPANGLKGVPSATQTATR